MIVGINHGQVNVPSAGLEPARAFYVGFLGMKEVARPAVFVSEGIWLNAGNFELHIGAEDNVERKTRAHLAYEVTDIAAWRKARDGQRLEDHRAAEDSELRAFSLSRSVWEQYRTDSKSTQRLITPTLEQIQRLIQEDKVRVSRPRI